jgi:hypothetical protein
LNKEASCKEDLNARFALASEMVARVFSITRVSFEVESSFVAVPRLASVSDMADCIVLYSISTRDLTFRNISLCQNMPAAAAWPAIEYSGFGREKEVPQEKQAPATTRGAADPHIATSSRRPRGEDGRQLTDFPSVTIHNSQQTKLLDKLYRPSR